MTIEDVSGRTLSAMTVFSLTLKYVYFWRLMLIKYCLKVNKIHQNTHYVHMYTHLYIMWQLLRIRVINCSQTWKSADPTERSTSLNIQYTIQWVVYLRRQMETCKHIDISFKKVHFTTITKQVIQLLLIMFVGTNICVCVVFECE